MINKLNWGKNLTLLLFKTASVLELTLKSVRPLSPIPPASKDVDFEKDGVSVWKICYQRSYAHLAITMFGPIMGYNNLELFYDIRVIYFCNRNQFESVVILYNVVNVRKFYFMFLESNDGKSIKHVFLKP